MFDNIVLVLGYIGMTSGILYLIGGTILNHYNEHSVG
jgi:hypothetical protein